MTEVIKRDENKINKYHNGKVYKIVNDIDDKVYIGSTCQPLYKRLYKHKSACKNDKFKGLIYQHFRNIGVEQMKIILVEEYKCNNKMELEKKEREYIEQYKGENSLNQFIPTRNKKEYYNENKDIIAEKNKEYRNQNKDFIKEINSKYYNENKDIIKENNKQYYNDNKDKIADNKKKLIICECGSELRKVDYNRHLKTIKHINYINNLTKQ